MDKLPKTKTKKLIPIGAAAKFLGVSIDTVRRAERKGLLKTVRPNGKDRFFSIDDLENFKKNKTAKKSAPKVRKISVVHVSSPTPNESSFSIPQIKPKITSVEELLEISRAASERIFQPPLTESKLQEFAKEELNKLPLSDVWDKQEVLSLHIKPASITIVSAVITSLLLFSLIVARVANFQPLLSDKQVAGISNQAQMLDSDVLAATSTNHFLDFNTDLIVEGDLAVGGLINNISFIPGEGTAEKTLTISGPVNLDQDLSTTSTPTFAGLNIPTLSATVLNFPSTSNQMVFNSGSAATGTLTWTPTSAVTLTLPNATDTLVGKATTDTLTNKTISGSDNTISNIQSSALSGSFTGITGLGTIGTGTWNGTKIGTTYGGTGLTSYTTGDILYASAADTLSKLAVGTNGQVLTLSSGIPSWGSAAGASGLGTIATQDADAVAITGGSITGITDLAVADGGTGTSTGSITGTTALLFAAGGSNQNVTLTPSGSGYTILNGQVGIGTVTPASQLEVKATTNPALTLYAGTGTDNILNVLSNDGMTTYFSIDSAGQMSASAFNLTDSAKTVIGTAIPGGWTNIADVATNDFTYKRAISVIATGDLAVNYEATVDITTDATASQIYSNTYDQSDPWKDFRLFYSDDGGSTFTEIGRNISTFSSTEIAFTFQIQNLISDGNTSSNEYYLFYSNSDYASMTTPSTYTGDIDRDTADTDDTDGWTSADGAYVLSAEGSSPAPQTNNFSIETLAMVDRMGSFSTGSQGQLGQELIDAAITNITIGGVNYVYVMGGNTGSADVSTVYKATITSNNLGTLSTGSQGQLGQILSKATVVAADSFDAGTGGNDLNTSTGAGCSGTGLSFAGSTCTITATGTYNFASITIPTGTILTVSQGVIATVKSTGAVSITGTVNLDGKGSAASLGSSPGNDGTDLGSCDAWHGGGGGGYGGAGGNGGAANTGGTGGGATGGAAISDSLVLGSGGGNVVDCGANGIGGAGGGAMKIVSGGNITINSGGVISANGANYAQGGAGGGSGGSIFLQAKGSITNSGTIRANGGTGGPSFCSYFDYTSGAGGGGGGGLITLQDADGSVSGTITANGGAGQAGCDDSGWQAGAGANGSNFTVTPSQVTINYYAYVLGGKNTSTYQSTVYQSLISSGNIASLSTSSQEQLPVTLGDHTSLALEVSGSDYVYVLGGYDGNTDTYYSTVYRATISSGNISGWTTASQGQLPSRLSNHAQTTLTISGTTYVYVLGGKTAGAAYSSAVYKATVGDTGNMGTFDTASQGQLPVTLYDLSAATATVGSVNYIYVFGGNTGAANVSTVYRATIDGSGNIGAFSTVGQGQLDVNISGHQTITNTDSGTTYFYTIGGTTGSPVDTVYKSTTTSDMTNFSITKTISAVDLSNKNDITFDFYPTDDSADLMEVAIYDDTGGWQTATFDGTADTWNPIDWDISALDRDVVTQIRFKVNSAQTTEFTTYIDSLQFVTEASGSDASSANSATLGAANLTLNAQGTGVVRLNYSDPADPTNFPNAAGSGGMAVYDGTDNALFTVNSSGYVGIGTTPTYPLDVLASGTGIIARFNSDNTSGCTLADGGTISCSSDERLKKNIDDISYGLEDLMKLNPVEFNWKYEDDTVSKSLGFIAQQVEKIAPKLVRTDPQTGLKELNTIGLIPMITKSIQEQQTQINDLRARVATLSAQINSSESANLVLGINQSNINELNLTPPETLLATTSAQLANLSVASEATFSGRLAAYQATISDTFKSLGKTFLGNTTVAGDFNIDGTMNISGNSLSTLNELHIQNGLLAGSIDFFDGKVVINPDGNLQVGGNLEISNTIVVAATAGEDLIAGDAVYISSDKTVSKSDATVEGKDKMIGLVTADALEGTEAKIATSGKLGGFSDLIPGSTYYLDEDGHISLIPSTYSLRNIQAGVAFSPTELFIQIFDFSYLIN